MKFYEIIQLLLAKKLQLRSPFVERVPTPEEITQKEQQTWDELRTSLLEGNDLATRFDGTETKTKIANLEILLNNARKEMILQRDHQINQGNAAANETILRVIRNVFADLLINELVGVQAISGPVELIHVLHMMNETNGKRMSLQVNKEVTVAKSRKLSARWAFEAHSSTKPIINGKLVDIEAEIIQALALEIGAEIDQGFLSYLRQLAGPSGLTYNHGDMIASLATPTENPSITNPTFVSDVHAALPILINRQSNQIARATCVGSGNKIVVSPTALTILQMSDLFTRVKTGRKSFVGTLNKMNVYVDQYADDRTPVLIAYKGDNEIDTGVIYSPYQLLVSSGTLIDPNTFEPVLSFLTRYGLYENTNAASHYKTVEINADALTFV